MHAADEVQRLRHFQPRRQHGDVGDEADFLHHRVALEVRAEHAQLAFIRSEPEDRLERGGLAGAVRADQSDDAAFGDAQVEVVERDGLAERLAYAARFDRECG